MPSTPPARPVYPSVLLGAAGVLVTVVVLASATPLMPEGGSLAGSFALWMIMAVVAGFLLRSARRKIFFFRRLSVHESMSFEAIFQAAILFNPQLTYPDVESEFLARHMDCSTEKISPWFRVRAAAALAIPLALAAMVLRLGHRELWAGFVALGCVSWVVIRSNEFRGVLRRRFLGAMTLGVLASLAEGLLFTKAAVSANLVTERWAAFLLYSILLAAFELSPVPFTLGSLEIGWLVLSRIPGVGSLPIVLAEAYRIFRAVPMLLIARFYLPRYKLSVSDLYDRRLPLALARARRRPAEPAERDGRGPLLSVVIPAYNERERLPRYLPAVLEYAGAVDGGGEVIVVDDGSSDETAGYVETLGREHRELRLVRQPSNQGKGAAVRRGVMEAAGQYILFADADGATPIEECSRLLRAAEDGCDVVIGSRKLSAESVKRERSIFREFIGSTFYRITNLLAVPGIEDTQCGFKLFRRSAARRIFPEMRENGWAFDVEVLFLAQKFGLLIEEVPVNWTAVEGSKVRPKDAFRMVWALLRIRRRDSGFTARPELQL